eukprot:TRINITY_DN1790_c0_g1_i10.p1 TRINITY_DN1790_c0_g1~~TRINITY_DN1790_c0_g1_i10.p1  ORF type:complete len:356 (-),score=94.91 TRINITY_DN1790_c0_g1_i10:23-1090(-)
MCIRDSCNSKMKEAEKKARTDLAKAQELVEEQYELLKSYEKIIASTKAELKEKSKECELHREKTEELTHRLAICKDELVSLNGDMNDRFAREEKKQNEISEKLRQLEELYRQKENEVAARNAEIERITLKSKSRKEELERHKSLLRESEDKLLEMEKRVDKLVSDNRELQQMQGESSEKIKIQLDELNERLKEERKKRIDAENANLDLEDALRTLQTKYQIEVQALQEELARRSRQQYNSIKTPHEMSPRWNDQSIRKGQGSGHNQMFTNLDNSFVLREENSHSMHSRNNGSGTVSRGVPRSAYVGKENWTHSGLNPNKVGGSYNNDLQDRFRREEFIHRFKGVPMFPSHSNQIK